MSDTQVTKNFMLSEFTPIPFNQLIEVQSYLIRNLANNLLQPIRDFLNCGIKISSAVRNEADNERLLSEGYHPSAVSDHFYGTPVPSQTIADKQLYGDTFYFSVGAADIIPDMGVEPALTLLMNNVGRQGQNGYLKWGQKPLFGQLIHEFNPVTKKDWIHISNPKSVLFSVNFSNVYLIKPVFLTSNDGGLTYISMPGAPTS